jgi:hypothetical protein
MWYLLGLALLALALTLPPGAAATYMVAAATGCVVLGLWLSSRE